MTNLLTPVAFPALGTTAVLLVSDPRATAEALAVLRAELDAIDRACSRFRPDSELCRLNASAGDHMSVSPLFATAVDVALRAARLSGGLVDPTVGAAMRVIGYDRDFSELHPSAGPITVNMQPVPGWQLVQVDRVASTIRIPKGVELDLGATAKALCADRAAAAASGATGAGVLVNLGGDVAVAGPAPGDGWRVRVTDSHADACDAPGQTVVISAGGVATSGTTVRRWRRGAEQLHHVIDPASGRPALSCWRTVSVAAGSCVDANTASTAALVLGSEAPSWLASRGLPARLVGTDGGVVRCGGWPAGEDVSC
jgi:thiamine biosynthesis lipoprotein